MWPGAKTSDPSSYRPNLFGFLLYAHELVESVLQEFLENDSYSSNNMDTNMHCFQMMVLSTTV